MRIGPQEHCALLPGPNTTRRSGPPDVGTAYICMVVSRSQVKHLVEALQELPAPAVVAIQSLW